MTKHRSSLRLTGDKKYLWHTFAIVVGLVMISGFSVLMSTLVILSRGLTSGAGFLFDPRLLSRLVWASSGMLVVISAVAFGVIWVYVQKVSGPLERLRKSLEDIAQGRLTAPIRFRNDDEFKNLADALNAVLKKYGQDQGPKE